MNWPKKLPPTFALSSFPQNQAQPYLALLQIAENSYQHQVKIPGYLVVTHYLANDILTLFEPEIPLN